jgi:hypothetical protein
MQFHGECQNGECINQHQCVQLLFLNIKNAKKMYMSNSTTIIIKTMSLVVSLCYFHYPAT